jgi:toxin CptA
MLRITLSRSGLLAVILLLAHACAVSLVLMMELPQWLKVAAASALILQCVFLIYRRALLLGAQAVLALEVASDHRMNILMRRAGWRPCDVLGSTYVTPYLTIMNLHLAGERMARHVVLLPDSLDGDDFRKLRVWLKWKNDTPASDPVENEQSR